MFAMLRVACREFEPECEPPPAASAASQRVIRRTGTSVLGFAGTHEASE